MSLSEDVVVYGTARLEFDFSPSTPDAEDESMPNVEDLTLKRHLTRWLGHHMITSIWQKMTHPTLISTNASFGRLLHCASSRPCFISACLYSRTTVTRGSSGTDTQPQ